MRIDVDNHDEQSDGPVPYQTQPESEPTSAPPVPKKILSASPPMTNVVPEAPDGLEGVSRVDFEFEPPEEAPEAAEDRRERIDYLKNIRDDARRDKDDKSGTKWYLVVPLVLVILVALGAVGWYLKPVFVHKPGPVVQPKVSQQTTAGTSAPKVQSTDKASTANFKEYTSANFPIVLKHPSDWTLTETVNELDILSPKQALMNAAGSSVQAAVLLRIRHQQASLPEFKAGSANAVLQSENIKYSTPAAGQRASTYLSFLQYATTTTKGGLDALYITGNAGYQKAQTVPAVDVTKVDPLVTVSFVDCKTTCTATSPALTVSSAIWTGDFQKTIETMLESLQISA